MAILGNAVKGSIVDRENGKVLSQEQIKEIQRVLLMVLEDIDAICREYGFKYSLIGGTAIGCMRHKGFIPWDDDVDIAMTRKDYEIFRVVINNKCSEKYSLTDARRENNYGKNIPKLRLKQTEYSTLLKVNPLDKEITTDIFIIENVDELKIVKGIHGVLCLIMGYLLACRRIAEYKETFCEVYKEKDFKIKLFIGKIISFISLDKWAHLTENVYSFCKNDKSKYVSVPTDRRHFFGEIFPRNIMCEVNDAQFEGKKLMIMKKIDYYLTNRYGDYMKIPPVEEQVMSVFTKLDLGPYKKEQM